jgi:hypothetical protein
LTSGDVRVCELEDFIEGGFSLMSGTLLGVVISIKS